MVSSSYTSIMGENKSKLNFWEIHILDILCIFYIVVAFLDIPIKQLQLKYYGYIFFDNSYIFIILITLFLLSAFINIVRSKGVFKIDYGLFFIIIYSLFMFFQCWIDTGLMLGLNLLYSKIFPILVFYLIIKNNDKINFRLLLSFVFLLSSINAVITIIQYLKDDVLWEFITDSEGNSLFWSINSSDFDRLRPPGMTSSALGSACISIIWICLSIYMFNEIHHKISFKGIFFIFSIILGIIALLCTQTRNAYFVIFFIVFYSLLVLKIKNKRYVFFVWLPVLIIAYYIFTVCVSSYNSIELGLSNSSSALIRVNNWSDLFEQVKQMNLWQLLFGICRWQGVGNGAYFSDSLYFDLLFSLGIIGLIFYIILNIKIQKKLLNFRQKEVSIICSLVASLLFIGVLNIPNQIYEVGIFMIAAIACREGSYDKRNSEEIF